MPPAGTSVNATITATVMDPEAQIYRTFALTDRQGVRYSAPEGLMLPFQPLPGYWWLIVHVDADLPIVGEPALSFVPEPVRDIDKPFLMPIEDVFSITGRGTVVTGKVEQGQIHTGDEVEIVGIKATQKTTCTGVEMFRKLLDEGQAGDNIGALLRGTKKEEVERGQVLCKPGSITPHTEFEGEVYVLTKEEGGRHKPFFGNYRPQFFFRTTDVTGTISLPEGTEMCMPGDNTQMTVELINPIAMDEGLRFAIREGGRTVGAGRVTKIIK